MRNSGSQYLTGWPGLGPVSFDGNNVRNAHSIYDLIEDELKHLQPRLIELEQRLDDNTKSSKRYRDAKKKIEWPLRKLPRPAQSRSKIKRRHTSYIDNKSVVNKVDSICITDKLEQAKKVISVECDLYSELAHTYNLSAVVTIISCELEAKSRKQTYTSSRSNSKSLSAWLSLADEYTRAQVTTVILGRESGLDELSLLYRRLYSHQVIVAFEGSSAAVWLRCIWDGSLLSDGKVIIAKDPGSKFLEPSSISCLNNEQKWPLITVVTVSFNQASFLRECIDSIIEQDYPNLQYILVDGGSTDGSINIIKSYEKKISTVIIESDEGQSDALNKGFSYAKGEIMTWINSDDSLSPNSLKRAALAFRDYGGVDIVAGTCERHGPAKEQLIARHFSAFPACEIANFDICGPLSWSRCWEVGDFFFQPEVFFGRDIWERSGAGFRKNLYWAMDWDLWIRFAAAGANIVRIPDIIGCSRAHADQKTTTAEIYLPQIDGILRDFGDAFRLMQDS